MTERNSVGREPSEGFCAAYTTVRHDIIEWIPSGARRILDVGCSTGLLGEAIKERKPGTEVVGIELAPAAAEEARRRIDRVIETDAEAISLAEAGFIHGYFDLIVYGDVLEHCRDPWEVLRKHGPFLSPGGSVIASLPNVRFWSVPVNLLLGNWPFVDRGIHDRTHLRFFTLRTMREMFDSAGYRVVRMRRTYRVLERPVRGNRILGAAAACALFPLRDLFTHQYIFLLEPADREVTV